MAAELETTYQGASASLYVILRRHSDAKVWDVTNTTWATWADGSIGDYDIAMTDKSGDLYQADFPTSIAAGTRVRAYYYEQAGGSPATTDLILFSEDMVWDGSGVSGSGSVTLDSNAMATLEDTKRHLGITASTYDDILKQFINQWSDKIERICGRSFAAANYNEWYRANGTCEIVAKNYPLIYVNRVQTGSQNAISVQYTGSDVDASVMVHGTGIRLLSTSAAGTDTTTDLTFATYPTLSTMATAIDGTSGWSGSNLVTDDGKSAALHRVGGMDAKSQARNLTWADTRASFDVDWDNGLIRYSTSGRFVDDITGAGPSSRFNGLVYIEYRGGYETIPDDVALLCIEMVQEAFDRTKLNVAASSESLGDYSYSVVDSMQLNAAQLERLAPYRDIPLGGG